MEVRDAKSSEVRKNDRPRRTCALAKIIWTTQVVTYRDTNGDYTAEKTELVRSFPFLAACR